MLAWVPAKARQQVAKGLPTHGRACWLLISRARAPLGGLPSPASLASGPVKEPAGGHDQDPLAVLNFLQAPAQYVLHAGVLSVRPTRNQFGSLPR